MEFKNSDRLGSRLLAINLRLAELDHELRQKQMHVHQLESQLENVEFARLIGDQAPQGEELGPELERSRGSLESQRELVEQVKKHQWKARVDYTLTRAQERKAERVRAAAAGEQE